MAIKRTRWSPDTCSCVIEYEWDDAVSPEARTHAPMGGSACSHHAQHATDHTKRFAVVAEENQRKNKALDRLIALGQDRLDIAWRFDEARVLHLAGPALTAHAPTLGIPDVVID